MDNASSHHSKKIEKMCSGAGVKLLYRLPYPPDLNPNEEFFSELKKYIKRKWKLYEAQSDQRSDTFRQSCVDAVGARKASAEAHFRHSGVTIKEFGDSA
jgi:transposase